MSLLEKAQELVDRAKQAAGRITGDHPDRDIQSGRPGTDTHDRIHEAAQDAKDRYRRH